MLIKNLMNIRGIQRVTMNSTTYAPSHIICIRLTWFSFRFRLEKVRTLVNAELLGSPYLEDFDEDMVFYYY